MINIAKPAVCMSVATVPFPTPEGSVLGDELVAVARRELDKLPRQAAHRGAPTRHPRIRLDLDPVVNLNGRTDATMLDAVAVGGRKDARGVVAADLRLYSAACSGVADRRRQSRAELARGDGSR